MEGNKNFNAVIAKYTTEFGYHCGFVTRENYYIMQLCILLVKIGVMFAQ